MHEIEIEARVKSSNWGFLQAGRIDPVKARRRLRRSHNLL